MKVRVLAANAAMTLSLLPAPSFVQLSLAQDQERPTATFRSSVDVVSVSAVVRDRKGRFVQDLTMRDFEVLDGGSARTIADFRRDEWII